MSEEIWDLLISGWYNGCDKSGGGRWESCGVSEIISSSETAIIFMPHKKHAFCCY